MLEWLYQSTIKIPTDSRNSIGQATKSESVSMSDKIGSNDHCNQNENENEEEPNTVYSTGTYGAITKNKNQLENKNGNKNDEDKEKSFESYSDADSISDMINLLPSEFISSVDRVKWCLQSNKLQTESSPCPFPGSLVLTNYRIILLSPRKLDVRIKKKTASTNSKSSPSSISPNFAEDDERGGPNDSGVNDKENVCERVHVHSRFSIPPYFSMTSIPISAICRLYILQSRNVLHIIAKDYRAVRVVIASGARTKARQLMSLSPSISQKGDGDVGNSLSSNEGRMTPSLLSNNNVISSSKFDDSSSDDFSISSNFSKVGTNNNQNGVFVDDRNKNDIKKNMLCTDEQNCNDDNDNTRNAIDDCDNHNHNHNDNDDSNNNHNCSIKDNNMDQNNNNYGSKINHPNINNSNSNSHIKTTNKNYSNNHSNHNNTNNNYNCNYTEGSLMSVNRAESILLAIQRRAFYLSIKSIEKPFAYVYGGNFNFNGWSYCDLEKEYKRQGILDCTDLRIFDNSSWSLCDTYPPYVVLPAGLSDVDIWTASAHRSKQRLPVVTYRHVVPMRKENMDEKKNNNNDNSDQTNEVSYNGLKHNESSNNSSSSRNRMTNVTTRTGGSVLTRSAQPLVGLTLKSCAADEKLLNLYRLLGKGPGSDSR